MNIQSLERGALHSLVRALKAKDQADNPLRVLVYSIPFNYQDVIGFGAWNPTEWLYREGTSEIIQTKGQTLEGEELEHATDVCLAFYYTYIGLSIDEVRRV